MNLKKIKTTSNENMFWTGYKDSLTLASGQETHRINSRRLGEHHNSGARHPT